MATHSFECCTRTHIQSKMFSIRNSRPGLKLKPPRVLVCPLLCLFAFSMILLVTQLRAIELAPNQTTHLSYKQTTNDLSSIIAKDQERPKAGTRNETEGGDNGGRHMLRPSSDLSGRNGRDKFTDEVEDHQEPSNECSQHAGLPSVMTAVTTMDATNEPSASISNSVLVDGRNADNTPAEPANAYLSKLLVSNLSEPLPVSQEQLASQAAAEMIASLGQQRPSLFMAPNETSQQQQLPSLAELTAAGTAAGLLMHDLIAQANMIQQLPYGQPAQWPSPQASAEVTAATTVGTSDDESDESDIDPMDLRERMLAQHRQAQLQERRVNDEDDEEASSQPPIGRTQREELMPAMGRARGAPLQAQQTANQHQATGPSESEAAPEPPDESQMPDSIMTLMGAAIGSGMDEREEGTTGSQQERSSIDDADNQQQQPANSNLHAQNNLPPGTVLAKERTVAAANRGEDEIDEDGADDSGESANSRIERRTSGIPVRAMDSSPAFRGQPVLLAGNELIPAGHHIRTPEFEQNLVAPMRDSLIDLNTAAGHYYGKKKKKKKYKKVKTKKIIVKKKKKKIKYKVIKIKKKKVKKHHHKKKMHKHHKGHYPDHGKYYMYAKVPKKNAWEFGFKKGNKKHWISRHEKGHKNKFKTKVKWYDKKSKGKGFHVWDYNHHDKKKKHY